jgi:imidazolonepropionase-like amidohydrolase
MNRKEFLGLCGASAAAVLVPSCGRPTVRMEPPAQPSRPDEKLLLRNATIVDVERRKPRAERALLVSGGRIRKLLRDEGLPGITADRTVDLAGAFVIPGLINAHTHMSFPCGIGLNPGFLLALERQAERNAEECVRHGVTTVRDLLSLGNMTGKLKDKIGRGEVLGPRILAACAIDVPGSYGEEMSIIKGGKRFLQIVKTTEKAREAVRAGLDAGADLIKLFQQPVSFMLPGKRLNAMGPDMIRAVADEAAKRGIAVAVHQTEPTGLANVMGSGVRSIEHGTYTRLLTGEEIEGLRASKITVVSTISADLGITHRSRGDDNWDRGMVPEIIRWRDGFLPALINDFCEPAIATTSAEYYRQYADPGSYEAHHVIPWPDPKNFTAELNFGTVNIRAMHRAGVPFGCGNDGGVPFMFPGSLYIEMMLMEKIGIPAPDVLRMATAVNAKLLGLEAEIGTIEEGKTADIAVLGGDPLQSTRHCASPRMVFREGRLAFSYGLNSKI